MFASVCVLSYERLDFLKQCIASILTVAYADFELIVHDDGSEDEELREWLFRMSQTGVISHLMMNPPGHNEGQGIAMNRMAAVAKGDPIIKCDQDMILKAGWLKEVNEVLLANRNAGKGMCVHGACPNPEHCQPACEDAEPLIGALGIFRYPVEPVRYEDMLIEAHGRWEEHRDFVGSFIAIPRDAWEIFGPWEERSPAFAEDYEFKREVADTEGWCVALTAEQFGQNQGFGIGPSTVVPAEGEVAKIKPGPHIHAPEGV
jgi:glycosyltransferase involved in cell wall biosynthesis